MRERAVIGVGIAWSVGILFGAWVCPAGASVMGTPAGSSTVTATQESTGTFSFGGSTASCTTETFSGGLADPIEELEVEATYSGCTAFGFVATISMNGCAYLLYGGSEASENVFSGAISVQCPTGKAILIKTSSIFGTCELTIGPQQFLTKATYVNHPAASPKANVTLEAAITELRYTVTKTTGACPLTAGEKTNGQYTGKWLMKAESGGGAVEYLLWKATTLCKERLLPCPFKPVNKRHEAPETLRATATNSTIAGVYDDGTGSPTTITITCATSVLGGNSTEETSGLWSTRLKAVFPTLTFENCADELNNTCTVAPQGLGYTAYFLAVAAGNGSLELEPHFVIECKGRYRCAYKDAAALNFNGGAGTAFAQAALLQLKPEPKYVGLNCGGKESQKASWSAVYSFEEPANIFLSET